LERDTIRQTHAQELALLAVHFDDRNADHQQPGFDAAVFDGNAHALGVRIGVLVAELHPGRKDQLRLFRLRLLLRLRRLCGLCRPALLRGGGLGAALSRLLRLRLLSRPLLLLRLSRSLLRHGLKRGSANHDRRRRHGEHPACNPRVGNIDPIRHQLVPLCHRP
jgi:hypothetical protein